MNRKTVALVLIGLAAALLVYWAISGSEVWTLQEVEVKTVDSLFGTETSTWEKEYRPGLLDTIGPASGVLLLISAWLLWSAARKRRNDKAARPGTM